MQTNPYEVLGVSEKDSLEHIDNVYKSFMRLLHPDKAHSSEAKSLNMGKEEKLQYMQLIRKAYIDIMEVRKETKYPDYKMDYQIDQESKINLHNGLTEDDAKNFNTSKFNNIFNLGLERDKKAGVYDPFGRGYGEFDVGKKFSDEGTIVMPTYNHDVPIETPKVFHRPDMKDNRLVEYIPESAAFANTGMDYQELGLTNISDFSMITSGKGSINGTDLMSVYGQNYEPWEHTVKRDSKLYAKFTDESNLNSRMAKIEQDRGGIYDLPLDQKMIQAESTRNFAMEQQEKIRNMNKQKRDEYYNELNKGRLNNGVPPR